MITTIISITIVTILTIVAIFQFTGKPFKVEITRLHGLVREPEPEKPITSLTEKEINDNKPPSPDEALKFINEILNGVEMHGDK